MTDADAVVSIDWDCRVLLAITSNAQPEDRWEQQLELLRSTGARFDDGTWYVWLDGSTLTAPHLAPLWRAAVEYGAGVRIDAIKPRSSS
jgi:hypothetical protein